MIDILADIPPPNFKRIEIPKGQIDSDPNLNYNEANENL